MAVAACGIFIFRFLALRSSKKFSDRLSTSTFDTLNSSNRGSIDPGSFASPRFGKAQEYRNLGLEYRPTGVKGYTSGSMPLNDENLNMGERPNVPVRPFPFDTENHGVGYYEEDFGGRGHALQGSFYQI